MGNHLTKEQQTLSDSLQQQYFFQSNQYLVHKASQRACTLHRISTYSKQQAISVKRNIGLYHQIRCSSISKLREFFQLDNSGYCSDQSKFYLVFDGHNSPNIKQEYFCRRYVGQGFSSEEIQSILSCMLCGLRHYYETFNRKQSRISLDSVCINRSNNNSLWIKDPWLIQKHSDSSQLPINFLAFYPSPEKIQASNQVYYDFNQFRSDLFSVGIFGLQLVNMNFRDDLYVYKKYVDRLRVNQSLGQVGNGRLRGGLEILLSQIPEERYKVYQYWDIMCSKIYRINSFRMSTVLASEQQQQQQQQLQQQQQQQQQVVRNPVVLQASNVRLLSPETNNREQFSSNPLPITQKYQKLQVPILSKSQCSQNFQQNINVHNKSQTVFVTQGTNCGGYTALPVQRSMYASQHIQPNLDNQFSKPILMKKTNQNQNKRYMEYTSFKKRSNDQKIKFHVPVQQSHSQNSPHQNNNPNKIKLMVRPQSQGAVTSSFSPMPYRSFSSSSNQLPRSTNIHSPIKFTISNPQKNAISPNVEQYFQSKCLQPLKFNYQNPYGNINNNDVKSMLRENSQIQKVVNSFQYNSKHPSMILNHKNSSPILTKSIITISQQVSNLVNSNVTFPRTSTSIDQQVNISNTSQGAQRDSLTKSNQLNQKKKNSISPKTCSPVNVSKQKNQEIEEVICVVDKYKGKDAGLLFQPGGEGIDNKIKNIQILPVKVNNVSLMDNKNNETSPTSPSTMQFTPPRTVRNQNKHNSTIVQVNEQTPNQSSQSEQNPGEIQFVIEQYETGSKYEGLKKNGLRHGRGKFFYQDGGYFDGEWKKNQMHGWGKLFYEGGQLAYEGNWAHDQFHGYGKVYNDNPVVLDGKFDYTNFDLLDDYWQYYEGMLANDTKEGRGRIQLTNKEVFEGDFHVDRIQGFGKFTRKDGTVIEGIWRDSRLIKVLNSNDIYK